MIAVLFTTSAFFTGQSHKTFADSSSYPIMRRGNYNFEKLLFSGGY